MSTRKHQHISGQSLAGLSLWCVLGTVESIRQDSKYLARPTSFSIANPEVGM